MLERAGLIVRSQEAQWRPSRMQVDPLDEAVEWMQSRKRTGWPGWTASTRTYARKEHTMSDPAPTAASEQEVLITRIFDAPRDQVFKAWTDPEEVAAWYGPEHFDTPREPIRIDLRVDGRYELTMVQRDGGGEFAIGYDIIELNAPELLVLRSDRMPDMGMDQPTITRVELYDHGANAHDPHRRCLRRRRRPCRGRLGRRLRQAGGAGPR